MIADRKKSLIMLVLLGVAIFIYNLGVGIFNVLGLEPLPSFEFLYSAIFICGVVWWLRAEIRRSPATELYCTGVFAVTAWPFMITYHLLKTRGWRGLLPLLALVSTFVIAKLLAISLYLALYGFPRQWLPVLG
jgi:hypothetical protein